MTRKCPSCNNRSTVKDTRETETTVRRVRQCIKCHRRWSTWETAISVPTIMRGISKAMRQIQAGTGHAQERIDDMQRFPVAAMAKERSRRSEVGARRESGRTRSDSRRGGE